jgi:glycine cleavage system H protein
MVKILQYEYPNGFYFSKDHMWAKIENDKVRVGITDFGQQIAGKTLLVRARRLEMTIDQGKILGTMETAKWVGPLKAPVSGVLVEFNTDLRHAGANLVNKDPYGEGWMFFLMPTNLEEDLKNLMTDPREIEVWLKEEIKDKQAPK